MENDAFELSCKFRHMKMKRVRSVFVCDATYTRGKRGGKRIIKSHDVLDQRVQNIRYAEYMKSQCEIRARAHHHAGMWFAGACPFAPPLGWEVLTDPDVLDLLRPMVKRLMLADIMDYILPDVFGTICTLSNLEELDITGYRCGSRFRV